MTENLECPHCSGRKLVQATRGSVALHGCGVCGGLWVGNELAKRMFERIEQDAMELARMAARAAVPRPRKVHEPRCPVCTQRMQRTRIDQTSIELDVCPPHGTWFDRNEFQQVSRWLEKCRHPFDNFPPPMRFDEAQYDAYFRSGQGGWQGGDDGWRAMFTGGGSSDGDGFGGDDVSSDGGGGGDCGDGGCGGDGGD